jgi:urease subunit gamma/beta
LTQYAGDQIVIGQNDVTNGPTSTEPSGELMTSMHNHGFLDTEA